MQPNFFYCYSDNYLTEDFQKCLKNPLFEQLIRYFISHSEEPIILRQLKKGINTTENMEFYLEKLIKYQLIQRQERKYRLNFPIFTKRERQPLSDAITNLDLEYTNLSTTNRLYVIGEWLWDYLFKEESSYFFGITNDLNKDEVFYDKIVVESEKWKVVSISPINEFIVNLPAYFSFSATREPLPELFSPLEQLIGDVDFSYFMQQFQRVIRSLKREQPKRNIFKEALFITGDLQVDQRGKETLVTEIIETDQIDSVGEFIASLEHEFTHYFNELADSNLRVLKKRQVFSALLSRFFGKGNSINYFSKISRS